MDGKARTNAPQESREEVTEKEDVFDDNVENAYGVNIVQEATTGSYCGKCDVTFKSKKSFRRHLIKSYETKACGRCDDMLYIWTESRVHVHKLHEDDDDDEEKKKGTNENS